MRHHTIPAPVITWLRSVRDWRPNLQSQRFWTQVAVIVTYVLHYIWAGLWVFYGTNPHLLALVTWQSFLVAAILVLVHFFHDRQSFRTLFPLISWAFLMGSGAAITWIGFRYPPGNGAICFFGLLGILAPLVGQALDVRIPTNKTE
jgi:hypothetical protein